MRILFSILMCSNTAQGHISSIIPIPYLSGSRSNIILILKVKWIFSPHICMCTAVQRLFHKICFNCHLISTVKHNIWFKITAVIVLVFSLWHTARTTLGQVKESRNRKRIPPLLTPQAPGPHVLEQSAENKEIHYVNKIKDQMYQNVHQ